MIKKNLKQIPLAMILLLCLAAVPVWAEEAGGPLHAWRGDFSSMHAFAQGNEFDALYEDIAQAAGKLGKDYTAAKVKEVNLKMYFTHFNRASVSDTEISFFEKNDTQNPVKVQYVSKGEKESKFKEHTVKWHIFESVSTDSKAGEYRYLIATEVHAHKGGRPHWHLRYGHTGVDDLIANPDFHYWWPTLVPSDFDVEKFLKGINPKIMAKMLP